MLNRPHSIILFWGNIIYTTLALLQQST